MTDPINGIGNMTERFTSLAADNKEKLAKQAINGVLLFVILAVFGCFDFVNFTFNFEVFDFVNHASKAVAYWTRVLAKTIAGVCAYNIGMNLKWDSELNKNAVLRSHISEYERLMKFKDPKTFDHYVVKVYNPAEKKRAWLDHISKKLYRLNKFARNKSILLYSTGTPEQKAKNRYCRKRAELEEMKSPKWVDENIDSVFVRYYAVDPIVFELDIDGKVEAKGAKVVGNVGLAKTKHTGSTILGIVGMSVITASIAIGADQQQFASQMQAFWYYFLSCVQDVGIVCWQVFKGMLADRKIINSEYVVPYASRVRVLNAYIDWCAEAKVAETKAYRILKEIERAEQQTGC